MKVKEDSDLWICGSSFLKPLTQVSIFELGESPKILLDSNVSGRYSFYSEALSLLPGDKITIFAEIEKSINNTEPLKHSQFEIIKNNSELNKLKDRLFKWYKKSFNNKLIEHYVEYMNSIPKMKGRSNLERVNCLIKHYKTYNDKKEITFTLLLCLINISLNCNNVEYFSKIIHHPQPTYTKKTVRNFLYDFFIIDNVNILNNEGYNVFFCTNDSGAAHFANYINKLTVIITLYELNIHPGRKGLYGIEGEVYNKIINDKELHEIIKEIRTSIYTKWNGKPNRAYSPANSIISQKIQLEIYGHTVNMYQSLFNWQIN